MANPDKARARLEAAQLAQDDGGLSSVEYAIILVLVAAIAMGTWQTFGPTAQRGPVEGAPQLDTSAANAANASSEARPTANSPAEPPRSSTSTPSGS
jgi:Flp pilus assembly pilin Flp